MGKVPFANLIQSCPNFVFSINLYSWLNEALACHWHNKMQLLNASKIFKRLDTVGNCMCRCFGCNCVHIFKEITHICVTTIIKNTWVFCIYSIVGVANIIVFYSITNYWKYQHVSGVFVCNSIFYSSRLKLSPRLLSFSLCRSLLGYIKQLHLILWIANH